ncbi:MAG: hypothetical protein HY744_32060 [Deltaproteobacteria bacterium]|nr:hypothetical protein [Deltaproteobacteria bacterium]
MPRAASPPGWRERRPPAVAALALALLAGCGGASPLMHPAHPLEQGEVSLGAGFSAELAATPSAAGAPGSAGRVLGDAAVPGGLSPWLAGRIGLAGSNEAGLGYTGRALRVDARHAFALGRPTLSAGIGMSALLPHRREEQAANVSGGGVDVPVLLGLRSDRDTYAAWIGARGSVELLRGSRQIELEPGSPSSELRIDDIDAWHACAGGLAGLRVGVRYLYAVAELGASMHFAGASVGEESVSLRQLGLAPAGALVGRF